MRWCYPTFPKVSFYREYLTPLKPDGQAVSVSGGPTKPRAAGSPLPKHALFGQTGRKETPKWYRAFMEFKNLEVIDF